MIYWHVGLALGLCLHVPKVHTFSLLTLLVLRVQTYDDIMNVIKSHVSELLLTY